MDLLVKRRVDSVRPMIRIGTGFGIGSDETRTDSRATTSNDDRFSLE